MIAESLSPGRDIMSPQLDARGGGYPYRTVCYASASAPPGWELAAYCLMFLITTAELEGQYY